MFSHLEYLYQHLPARFRREDRIRAFILKRFLSYFTEQMDGWDSLHEEFHKQINPQTADEIFVEFWLWTFFRWSWFPEWFTLQRKRELYALFATHLARRGTAIGIEEFLRAFSIHARVYNRPAYWGEFVWGEGDWTITEPLGLVVQIDHLTDEVNFDIAGNGWGEFVWGESHFQNTKPTLTRQEIEDLLRFQWPNSQTIMIEYARHRTVSGPFIWDSNEPFFNDDFVLEEKDFVSDWI